MTGSTSPGGEIIVHVFGRTDVGRTRDHNEDTFAVADLTTFNATLQPEVRTHTVGNRGSLFAVADGMGGAAAGEIASAMAMDVILTELDARWRSAPTEDSETFVSALRAATEAANAKIHAYAASHPENRGMGTTATVAGLLGDTLYLSQIGDSRAYIVRDGVASQITKDQSLMQKLVEAGELTVEEAEVSERRNIILQALGPEPTIKVDLTTQQVKRGDVLILCSDGLSGQVRASEIAEVVNGESDLVQICKKLIDLANEAGGPDNITVVAVRFEGPGLVESGAEVAEHRVFRSSQQGRATLPVDRSSIPQLSAMVDDEQAEIPTLESVPAVQPKVAVGTAGPGATARIAPAVRADLPDAPPPGGRVPADFLRMIFGGIAAVVLLFYLIRWIAT
ncbi:MAG: Stp1/IreP family PP2C-type Ser/Thr phosphatase [Gemmatimonadaceae bacterium]